VAQVIRETGAEAASGVGVAIRRRFHSHQPGPAGSAAELPQALRGQTPRDPPGLTDRSAAQSTENQPADDKNGRDDLAAAGSAPPAPMPDAAPTAPISTADLLPAYRAAAAEREACGIPPLPLTAPQAQALTQLLQAPPAGEEAVLLELLSERIPPGVDEAAYVKASWLSAVAAGQVLSPLVSPVEAVR